MNDLADLVYEEIEGYRFYEADSDDNLRFDSGAEVAVAIIVCFCAPLSFAL